MLRLHPIQNHPTAGPPSGSLAFSFDVGGSVFGGRLGMSWVYPPDLYQRSTVQTLADAFTAAIQALVQAARGADSVEYTPSDFNADLSGDELDDLLEEFGDYDED